MARRYFTVDEVQGMVPELNERFDRLLQIRVQMRQVYTRLEALGHAPVGDDFDIVVEDAPPGAISDRAALSALIAAFRDEIACVEGLGCEVKGVEPGLVDWYARVEGRDVLLCWRFGERAVEWWHEVEAGFSGRRPISELVERDNSSS